MDILAIENSQNKKRRLDRLDRVPGRGKCLLAHHG